MLCSEEEPWAEAGCLSQKKHSGAHSAGIDGDSGGETLDGCGAGNVPAATHTIRRTDAPWALGRAVCGLCPWAGAQVPRGNCVGLEGPERAPAAARAPVVHT